MMRDIIVHTLLFPFNSAAGTVFSTRLPLIKENAAQVHCAARNLTS
jgi:hypothetical protein